MEPTAITCAGNTCERFTGRLSRGMCRYHYGQLVRASRQAGTPLTRTRAVGCKIDDCDVELIQSRGLCAKHYSRWQKHGDPEREPAGPRDGCEADGCDRPHYCRGYCVMHYARLRAHGDATVRLVNETPEVCTADDCDAPASQGLWCSTHRARMQRLGTLELQVRDRYRAQSGYWHIKRPEHPLAPESGWIREHRVVLFDAIGPGEHECHWCRTVVSWDLTYPSSRTGLVVDHVDENPGNNDPANLVPSCAPCNLARSSRWKKRRQESA